MSIEWDKIRSNPTKSHKIHGTDLLGLKRKIESLEKNVSELTANSDELGNIIKNLETELKEKKEKIGSLENKVNELNGSLAKTKKEAEDSLNDTKNKLEQEIDTKTEKISDLEKTISEKTNENENLNKEISEKNGKITELEDQTQRQAGEISELKSKGAGSEGEISNLRDKVSELGGKVSELEKLKSENESKINELVDKASKVDALQKDVSVKDEKINELNNKIEEANTEITKLNDKIEELKEQIPKKPVYEEAEETVKGGPCPKCGFPTYEEYKFEAGEKHLIRKYCPNTHCGWRSVEKPKIRITMTTEMPEEIVKELKIYQVKREGLEVTDTLNSKMVAIIVDPAQNIIWIWKGKDASRFEYADATNQASNVKKKELFQAHIQRVEEGEEPENFPVSIT
ncbi:MAG: hypothetical protein ACFFDN_08500 [Candidatus Hodarchaeota archaeon]